MDVVRRQAAHASAAFALVVSASSAGAARGMADTLLIPIGGQSFAQASVQAAAGPVKSSLHGLSLAPHAVARPTNLVRWPWDGLIAEASRRFDIPEAWVRTVMRVESGGRAMLGGRPITSSAGAMGLMQLMPATFADMTRRYGLGGDPYEPRANILAGAAFLRELYDRYGPEHFLAAYNAGPGRVDDHLRTGRPLPLETRRYVQRLALLISGDSMGMPTTSRPLVVHPRPAGGLPRATRSSSRSLSNTSPRPRTAPLFAVVKDASKTRVEPAGEPPENTLFVHHSESRPRPENGTSSGTEK